MQRLTSSGMRRWGASAAAIALLWGTARQAGAAEAQPIDIAPAPLDRALMSLAAQTHVQMLYSPELVAGRVTAGLHGRYSPQDAAARLLAGAPVTVSRTADNVIVIRPRRPSPGPRDPLAAAGAADGGAPGQAGRPSTPSPSVLQTIVVTGTHIRGAGAGASPVLRLDRDALSRTGESTLARALQVLPQSFGGQSTEGTVNTRGDPLGTNAGYGTSINLHGLGADATLVLVNGRRLAGSGLRGDFVDLSSLPAIAVDRVEVLLDGASAIYGSDAVGGVVNVILRRDLDGGEISIRGGIGRGGDPREGVLGLVAGKTWSTGGLLVAYEAYDQTALSAADRSFTASSDLRPFGGTDHRDAFSYPGNILRRNPATGATTPYWAIPAGQDGIGLPPTAFQPGTVNRQNENVGLDLLPSQNRQSVYAAGHQALAPWIEVSGDVRYADRSGQAAIFPQTATLTVTRANPFYVSPVGAPQESIQYNFAGELPNPVANVDVQTLSATLGTKIQLPQGWTSDAYLAFAQEKIRSDTRGLTNAFVLNEALGLIPDNPASGYVPSRDGYFNPFTGIPGSNPAAVLSAIGSGFSDTTLRNRVTTANLQADGSVLRLPGGDLKVAVGAQWRGEDYLRQGLTLFSTATPTPQSGLDAHRNVEALFAEARLPLFGPANARPGLQMLELSAAVRAERYDGFGSTVNPKVGLVWTPTPGLRLRATYGRAFRAPALQEIDDARVFTPLTFQDAAGRVLTLALQGANPGLRPETANTWTAGFDATPERLPGLRLSASWFRTDFTDRIDRPGLTDLAGVLTDPRLTPFVQRIDPLTSPADLAQVNRLLADPATTTRFGVFPATSYRAIVDLRYVNTGRLDVEGVDAQASFARPAFGGAMTFAVNQAWIYRYVEQITPTAPPVNLVGFIGAPPRLRLRGSADWTRGPFTAELAANAASGMQDALGDKVSAQLTFDLFLRLQGHTGRFAGTALTLSVRNLFNRDPPFYNNPTGLGYDPATGDPIGRLVSLQLTRSW